MFQIDHKLGIIRWEQYLISPKLTCDAVQKLHPELSTKSETTANNGDIYREIQLPIIQIANHGWRLTICFRNQRITAMIFDSAEVVKHDYANDGETAWLRASVEWLEIAKKLFTDQLGKPDSSEWKSYFMYDEWDYLSASQLEFLKVSWEYTFPWGTVWFGYETQEPGGARANVVYTESNEIIF